MRVTTRQTETALSTRQQQCTECSVQSVCVRRETEGKGLGAFRGVAVAGRAAMAAAGPRRLLRALSLLAVVMTATVFASLVETARARLGGEREPQYPMAYDGREWVDVRDKPSDPKPFPPHSESWRQPDTTLFIGISAYRDGRRCGRTLKYIFSKAAHPQRIHIGLVQQRAANEQDCILHYCSLLRDAGETGPCPYVDQIRNVRINALEARGPMLARYIQGGLIEDEEFCMQIDSHMDFEDRFDEKLMEMWAMTENEYGVLSTYVNDLSKLGEVTRVVPRICQLMWKPHTVRNQPAKQARNLDKPLLTALWGAGLSFSKCHAERKTRYDPRMPQIFDGEEFTKFARLWTHGYDVYTPHHAVVVHDYTRPKDHNPTGWKHDENELKASTERLNTLLGLPDGPKTPEAIFELGRYGLGAKRSLDQLIEFSGADLRNKRLVRNACGKITWVPFDEDPDPEVELGDIWGLAPYKRRTGDRSRPPIDRSVR